MTARVGLWTWLCVGSALCLVLFASMLVGHVELSVDEVIAGMLGGGTEHATTIVQELRLPRTLIGLLVGASLGLAGAAMQGLLRNPLAEPGVIGVSGCAGLGAVLVFYSGLSASFVLALPLGGMLGALVAVMLLYVLAGASRSGRSATLTLILGGVALNAFAGAMTSLALNLSANPFAAYEVVFWLMGSLADRSMDHVLLCLVPMVIGAGLILASGRGLDALSLGEPTAHSLGVNLPRIRLFVILGTGMAVGSAVAVSGMIGFVGLVVPHLLRPFVGHQPSRLLPLSAAGGALLLIAADLVVRMVPTAIELKIGVVTAIVGAPFFLMLILRHRRGAL